MQVINRPALKGSSSLIINEMKNQATVTSRWLLITADNFSAVCEMESYQNIDEVQKCNILKKII